MIDTNATIISKIGKSRKIILDLLKKREYNIEDYINFSNNELNLMHINNELDMILFNEFGNKIKIIYILGSILRPNKVLDYVEDLYNMENVLNLSDELILIQQNEPNESLINCINNLYKEKGIYVNIFSINRLQYNVLDHNLVPVHKIMNEEELKIVKDKYNIINNKQFPEISRFDPVSMVIGLRPGRVCEISRNSVTSLNTKYYRICS
jgi:DNA-directed RNA polymerase subunit H (RpoH/RPB5)